MFTALMIIKVMVIVWSLIFIICLYHTMKKLLTKIPTIWINKNNKDKNF